MNHRGENMRSLPWKYALCGLASVLALVSCLDPRVAGSSVGTGNPTEIQLGFKQDGSTTAITGRVDVYAATQIPVPGFSPQPLRSLDVSDQNSVSLTAAALSAIPDSLWPKTSVEGDSIYRFNLVVSGAAQGAILQGFDLQKNKDGSWVGTEETGAKRVGDGVVVTAALTPLAEVTCTIDSSTLSQTQDSYLFLYGTGFAVKGASGNFKFTNLPKGEYESHLLAVPRKDAGLTIADSLNVYNLSKSIHSDSENVLSVSSVSATIPTPDSLKNK